MALPNVHSAIKFILGRRNTEMERFVDDAQDQFRAQIVEAVTAFASKAPDALFSYKFNFTVKSRGPEEEASDES